MKKGIIILLVTVLLPLLCNAAHRSFSLSATNTTESIFRQRECARQQSPLENEREYTDSSIWCLFQAFSTTSISAKWQGGATGNSAPHSTHSSLQALPQHISSHLPFPSNWCNVFIRLHHLLI